MSYDPDIEPFERNGWRGLVTMAKDLPPRFRVTCKNRDRLIQTNWMSAEELEAFDPDAYWSKPAKSKNARAIGWDQK